MSSIYPHCLYHIVKMDAGTVQEMHAAVYFSYGTEAAKTRIRSLADLKCLEDGSWRVQLYTNERGTVLPYDKGFRPTNFSTLEKAIAHVASHFEDEAGLDNL